MKQLGLAQEDINTDDDREERALRMWMNSTGIDRYIHNLYLDCRDGISFLQLIDSIEPGIVDWKHRVELKPTNKFKMISNNNYLLDISKVDPFKFSLVGIGGSDLFDGVKKLVLSEVWQLMRFHIIKFLQQVYLYITL